jgi:hypothetical protein
MSASSDWAKAAAAGLSLWLLVAPTAVGAACLAGYESSCAELKAPYQRGALVLKLVQAPLGRGHRNLRKIAISASRNTERIAATFLIMCLGASVRNSVFTITWRS